MTQERKPEEKTPDVESVRTDDRGRWEDDGGNSQVHGQPGYRADAGRPDLPGPRPVGPHGEPIREHRSLEDERVRGAANDALTSRRELRGQPIECRCENGEVVLTGSVSRRRWKRLAYDTVRSVAGVRAVHDRLALASGIAGR